MENALKPANSKVMTVIGWILSIVPSLLLIMSGVMKFMPATPDVTKELDRIGWRADQVPTLGVIEIACTILFLIPQTSVLGAILVTGYMGGAIATHVRVGGWVFVQALIPIVFWLGLWLRDPRLREILPIRK